MKLMEDGELRRGKSAEDGTLGKGTEEQKAPFKDSERKLPKRQEGDAQKVLQELLV